MKTQERHLRRFVSEIVKRGGETEIIGRYGRKSLCIIDTGTSERRKVWLLRAEGWRHYSYGFGSRKAMLAYLCGYDDSGTWAVRVPGPTKTAEAAIKYIVPSHVRLARRLGWKVKRQGDVYAVCTLKQYDGTGLTTMMFVQPYIGHAVISNHEFHHTSRLLLHHSHAPVVIDFPARFIAQNALGMGRGRGRGAGMAD